MSNTDFFTTIFLPILAIVISIATYYFQKTKRTFAYRVISSESLPTFDEPISELKYPDKEIIVEYINTGNVALEAANFHSPITTYFPNSKLYSAKKYFQDHNDEIEFDIIKKESSAYFTPDLVNPGESIFVKFHVGEFRNSITIRTRIKDGKQIYNQVYKDNLKEKFIFISLFYICTLCACFYLTRSLSFKDNYIGFLSFAMIAILWIVHDYISLNRKQY